MSELRLILRKDPDKKKKIFREIGQKLSQSRKSSRKKLEGISKKLNLSLEMLKKIESGEIDRFPQSIHITGFLRAFAEKVNCDISSEISQLSDEKKSSQAKIKKVNLSSKNIFFIFVFFFTFIISVTFYILTKTDLNKLDNISETKNGLNNHLDYTLRSIQDKNEENKILKNNEQDNFFEILFLEETWIEISDENKKSLQNGLFNVGDSMKFNFQDTDSDFFIKSGNLGGFQIFYKSEFFAPFGLTGQVSKGFFLKEKINSIKNIRNLKNEY